MKQLYPHVRLTKRFDDVLESDQVDAVCIATPVRTHYPLGMACLRAGKHTFIEKPMAASSREGAELVREAAAIGLNLMVGHTFVYTAAVNKLKELIDEGELGDVFYVQMTRVNLGIFQEDINVVWDLAPHDVSILMYALGCQPLRVQSFCRSYIREGVEDVAFLNYTFPNNITANLHVSWLDPCKIRRTTVVGSRRMLVYDDVETLEKIRVYDKGVTMMPHYDTFGEFHLAYRHGDIFTPRLDDAEPLKVECSHFLECIQTGKTPRSDGLAGLQVVQAMEAANESLRKGGATVEIVQETRESVVRPRAARSPSTPAHAPNPGSPRRVIGRLPEPEEDEAAEAPGS
jgi:predicted dehydrogenase